MLLTSEEQVMGSVLKALAPNEIKAPVFGTTRIFRLSPSIS